MAIREKISSVYINKQEKNIYEAFKLFKDNKSDYSLSHSDLYKAGLALYKTNPTLISTCKMLLTNKNLDAEKLTQYFSLELGTKFTINSIEVEPSLEKTDLTPLILLIQEQSKKIERLTELINSKESLIKTEVDEINSSSQSNKSKVEDISESLDAYDKDGKTKLDGVIKEAVYTGSDDVRDKIRRSKLF